MVSAHDVDAKPMFMMDFYCKLLIAWVIHSFSYLDATVTVKHSVFSHAQCDPASAAAPHYSAK